MAIERHVLRSTIGDLRRSLNGQNNASRLHRSKVSWSNFGLQLFLFCCVAGIGSVNNIARQIASKPLVQYMYVSSLAANFFYIPVFGLILVLLISCGVVPRRQVRYVLKGKFASGVPIIFAFAIAAGFETFGDVVSIICVPYVSGPVHALTTNSVPLFGCPLSMLFLHRRFSFMQCVGLLCIMVAVVIGIIPSFEESSTTTGTTTNPLFAMVCVFICVFWAGSYVIKELIYQNYLRWAAAEGFGNDDDGLNAFVVTFFGSLLALPVCFLSAPINIALGQTNGLSFGTYLQDSYHCVAEGICGPKAVRPDMALLSVVGFVFINTLYCTSFNVSVKYSDSVATFLSVMAIFPISTVTFAFIDWPLLGKTPVHWLMWLSVIIFLPSMVLYKVATALQEERANTHPSLASCCFPFGQRRQISATCMAEF